MEKVILYQDNNIEIYLTGRDYDFIAVVDNFSEKEIKIKIKDDNVEYIFEDFTVKPCDWVGILADNEGYSFVEAVEQNNLEVEPLT